MNKSLVATSLSVLMLAGTAYAESCHLRNADTVDRPPRIVRIFEDETGHVVWQGAVSGGQTINVSVAKDWVRFDYRYPGDLEFHSSTRFFCKDGESTDF